MIISKLEHSSKIEPLHPLFKRLFDYVKQHDLFSQAPQKIMLEGDELFINHVLLESKKKSEQLLEIHRDYIDVHILLSGKETIGWKALEDLTQETKAYDKAGDCALYGDTPTTYADILPGEFVIVYPEAPHAPAIGEGPIRKLIAKVKV